MARNLLEEQLSAIRHQKSMYNWKKSMETEITIINEIDCKIKELNKEELKILEELKIN